jgi:DMSO reductase anchor subunit
VRERLAAQHSNEINFTGIYFVVVYTLWFTAMIKIATEKSVTDQRYLTN